MSNPNEPLELNETYRHINSLVWQIPSWGIAIATGVIVAAGQIGNIHANWLIPVTWVQASVLFIGFSLLLALSLALSRYLDYLAACAPCPIPSPPFNVRPRATWWLQGAITVATGIIFGLFLVQLVHCKWIIILGGGLGVILWIYLYERHKKTRNKINEKRK